MNKLNSLISDSQYVELLDRTEVIKSMIDNFLIQHPLAKINQNILTELELSVNHLIKVTQIINKLNEAEVLKRLDNDMLKIMNNMLIDNIGNKPNKNRNYNDI